LASKKLSIRVINLDIGLVGLKNGVLFKKIPSLETILGSLEDFQITYTPTILRGALIKKICAKEENGYLIV